MPSTDSLYSTLKNTSGKEGSFGYIPPHSRRLAPNETITVFGNVVDRIAKKGERQVRAFERDLSRGDIELVSTPSLVLDVDGAPKVIGEESGELGMVDPSWVP